MHSSLLFDEPSASLPLMNRPTVVSPAMAAATLPAASVVTSAPGVSEPAAMANEQMPSICTSMRSPATPLDRATPMLL